DGLHARAARAFLTLVQYHQFRCSFGSRASRACAIAQRNTSSQQGSWRTPVVEHRQSYSSRPSQPASCSTERIPRTSKSRIIAGPTPERSLRRRASFILESIIMPAELVCFEPSCRTRYALDEVLYSCPKCGGLLEAAIERPRESADALKSTWRQRRTCNTPVDQSGVWRYRELLPFGTGERPVTLREGNTPLLDA